MITKAHAKTLSHGDILHHVTLKNADGTPVRARINGACQTWVTRPAEFHLPVKYGLRDCFAITEHNAAEWE